ncbi:MAG: NlpC/P60 family protein [Clostridiaceae bacterium]
MKKVKYKVLAAIIASSTLFGVVSPVYATPVSDETVQNIEAKQAEYKEIEARINALHLDIDAILDEITIQMTKIEETNAKISEVEANKALIEADIVVKQQELAIKEVEYGDRLRAMYKQGNNGVIDAILGSESISDFVSRADAIIKIAKIDKAMLDEIDAMKKDLEAIKEELQNDIAELVTLNDENKKNLAIVEVKKAESDAKLKEMEAVEAEIKKDLTLSESMLLSESEKTIKNSNSSISQLNSAIEELRAARSKVILSTVDDKIVDLIEEAKDIVADKKAAEAAAAAAAAAANKAPKSTSSTLAAVSSTASATGSAIVKYSYNFLGIPYVWGGTTLSGLDCSGFTKLVYAHFGINLPRVSRDQAKVGTYVPISQAQPGDLVYFGQTNVTHIGIYIGNNQMIHAPSPGKSVMISSMTWHINNYNIVGARRIINN